ncbi:unnamed protein product [Blepharisma stoltei]|uniref:Transposase n=1 Tax=Blepharisma stoltei TaxID=1481888 RepID=A0AAU9IBY6_9CILI|nr:unnamed protein product [Blepharisma stoltei]
MSNLIEVDKIRALADRLVRVRDLLTPLNVNSRQKKREIPNYIKEELVKIYDEYGGSGVFKKLFNISSKRLRAWRKKLKENPNCFSSVNTLTTDKSAICIDDTEEIKNTIEKKSLLEEVKKKEETNKISYINEVRNILSKEIIDKCEEIKHTLKIAKTKKNKWLDSEIKQEIVALVNQVGYAKPIAVILDIDERIIEDWRNSSAGEIKEGNEGLFDEIYR